MATSDASARVGAGAAIMLSSICVATTTGLPARARSADQALLLQRHLLGRQLHAEVAARHHHAVGERQDRVESLDRLRLFHLGHEPGAAGGDAARLGHVLRALHEGKADLLDAVLQREGEVRAVLLGQRRDRQRPRRGR